MITRTLFTFLLILTIGSGVTQGVRILPSPLGSDTGQGRWSPYQLCEEGTYVLGMYITSTFSSSDDPSTDPLGITQLKLMCGKSDGAGFRVVLKNLTSGPDTYHQSNTNPILPQIKYCKQYGHGFNLKNLKANETVKYPNADRNALGMRLQCAGTPVTHLEGGLDDLGTYATPAGTLCPAGEYLCGMRVKTVKSVQDLTIVTNMDGRCCPEVLISKACTPFENWVTVFEYDNRDSKSVINTDTFSIKSYARWVVMEEEETDTPSRRPHNIPITGTTAFINSLIDPLVPRYAKELGQHKEFGYDWSKLTKVNWMAERVNSFTAIVEPYSLFRIEQLVGRCGVVEMLADSFKISVVPESGFNFYLGIIGGLVVLFVVVLVAVVVYMRKRNRPNRASTNPKERIPCLGAVETRESNVPFNY